MRVVGTAGHVDHGKSSLVKALTGIDPDRLREEKERQMTIDLGFAWLELPSGRSVSIVDVPGHEDFIKNMLAGVGGIDVGLFVVAADEGVMPQTKEHLAILDLLGVKNNVIALTKQDLVDDPDWLELVEEDLREQVAGTCLEGAPIIPVSAKTGYGLDKLLQELDRVVAQSPPKRDINRPRLPIDRVFSLAGFGTVVTGTLTDGKLRVGQEVEILPKGLKSRIRGLQTHKQKVEEAIPGSRVAINLTGLSTDQLERGDVVAAVGQLRATNLLDVHLRLLSSAPKPLRHNHLVDFYIGASVVQARVRLLAADAFEPGREGWAQLALSSPVVAVKGDRFVIRQASPSLTLGGGVVVDPLPSRRYRRFRQEVIARLETLAQGTPEEILAEALRLQAREASEALSATQLDRESAEKALKRLLAEGQVIALAAPGASPAEVLAANRYVLSLSAWGNLLERMTELLADYHRANPLRGGMPRGELRNRLNLSMRLFNDALAQALAEGRLAETPTGDIRLLTHEIRFSPQQQAAVDALLAEFAAAPYTTPSVAASEERVGSEVLAALLEQRKLVKVSNEVLFLSATYDEMVSKIVAHLRDHGTITLAQVRDMFNTSRKYAAALLEHLDEQRVTRRVGDERVLRTS